MSYTCLSQSDLLSPLLPKSYCMAITPVTLTGDYLDKPPLSYSHWFFLCSCSQVSLSPVAQATALAQALMILPGILVGLLSVIHSHTAILS